MNGGVHEVWRVVEKNLGCKPQKRQQNGSTVNKMLSWWQDCGSTVSHRLAGVAFLKQDLKKGREVC